MAAFPFEDEMSIKNIKLAKQEENLSEANIKKVIAGLEPETGKPITKKLACEMLCISYNVKRLDTIITKYKEQAAFREKKMSENRGTPATTDEIQYCVKQYMRGDSVAQIARDLFRGVSFVNNVLECNDVPRRPRQQDYNKPELIPESSIRLQFAVGEKVYSARYDSIAVIKAEFIGGKSPEKVYSIYLSDEKWNMYAYQPASELASLETITKKLGIVL